MRTATIPSSLLGSFVLDKINYVLIGFLFLVILTALFFYSPVSPPSTAFLLSSLPGDEICGNLIDDDGDGYIDADDPDCIAAGGCGCPPGGIVYDTLSAGHIVPAGASHCVTDYVLLVGSSSNLEINGNLYIVDTAQLFVDDGLNVGPNGNLIICDNASYILTQPSNTYQDIYNFGWIKTASNTLDVENIIMGPNSLTVLGGDGLNINGSLAFLGSPDENSYLYLDITTTLNGGTGNICLAGGTPEMIVEIDEPGTAPTCVTDCNGCDEMAGITEVFFDKSVEAAYNAIIAGIAAPEEICGNSTDDNNDGRVDEPFPGGVQGNMQLWLKADQGTNTTTSTNNITSWADQSINSYSADADVNATDFPTYDPAALNFNPGILFDGTYTDDFSDGLHLGSDYIYSTNAGIHIFTVLKPTKTGGQYDKVFDFGGAQSQSVGFTWTTSASRYNTPTVHGGVSTFFSHNIDLAPSLVACEVKFGDSQIIHQNGGVISSSPITLSQLTSTELAESDHYGTASNSDHQIGPVSIGRKSGSEFLDQNRIFDGSVSEVLVYNDTLSEVEIEKINSYLAIKYGLLLTHNYYSASGTLLKDLSDGYENTVFGIGREDCSGLYQKQSKSVEPEGIVTVSRGVIAADNQSNGETITQDEGYYILGNDGQNVTTWTPIGGSAGDHVRIGRTWKINRSNFDETTTLTIDMDDPDLDIASIPASARYKIMLDTDGDFTNGGNLTTNLNNTSGSLYELRNYSNTNFHYFTIVYEAACEAQAPVLTK